ncbi:unnamed protein product, partial [Laminaria digitata]
RFITPPFYLHPRFIYTPRLICSQEKNGREAPVFVYEFTHPTEVPDFAACAGLSCHTAELPYVFNNV